MRKKKDREKKGGEPKFFYHLVAGKPEPYPFKEGELSAYKERCSSVWGNAPCDVIWAMNSVLFKEGL